MRKNGNTPVYSPCWFRSPVIAFLSFWIAEYTAQPVRSLFINVYKTVLKSTNPRLKRVGQNRKINRNWPSVQFKCPIVGSTQLWLPLIAVVLSISSDNSTVCWIEQGFSFTYDTHSSECLYNKNHIYITSAVSLNSSSACHAIIKQEIIASFASYSAFLWGLKGWAQRILTNDLSNTWMN